MLAEPFYQLNPIFSWVKTLGENNTCLSSQVTCLPSSDINGPKENYSLASTSEWYYCKHWRNRKKNHIGSNQKLHFESFLSWESDHKPLQKKEGLIKRQWWAAILHGSVCGVGVISGCYDSLAFSRGTVQVAFLRSHHDRDIASTIPASHWVFQQMPRQRDGVTKLSRNGSWRWISLFCVSFLFWWLDWLAFFVSEYFSNASALLKENQAKQKGR